MLRLGKQRWLDNIGNWMTSEVCCLILDQFRQMKRGSLGALTMNQLMKRQLEHQSSAPHNISTWDTGRFIYICISLL